VKAKRVKHLWNDVSAMGLKIAAQMLNPYEILVISVNVVSKDLRLFGRYQKGSMNPQKKSEIWVFTFPFAFLLFTWQKHR